MSPEAAADAGEPEFTATLSGGRVALGGRLPGERARGAAESLARARFPGAEVGVATRTAEGLPEGWRRRALAGLEALALLEEGEVVVREDGVSVAGTTGDPDAEARATVLLSEVLGGGEDLRLRIAYDPALDPAAGGPSPEECLRRIGAAQAAAKITFAPGSDAIEAAGLGTLDAIAEILGDCSDLALEVAGHTDSQGREGMNLELSRERATAVVEALAERRAPVAGLRPVGYGEAKPVADNDTAEGRESNRRIEFTRPEPEPEAAAAAQ